MNADLHFRKLRDYVEQADYAGHDPYDALNSPVLKCLSARSKWLRIFSIQSMRRSPINLRRQLGTPAGRNPKGLGLFLEGYCHLARDCDPATYSEPVERLLELLYELKSPHYTGNGWGYNFDWQTPVFFIPRHTPTIVNSAFIGHALLDAADAFSSQRALDLAVPIKDFILHDLHRISEGDTFCFSYTPLDRYAVHNANLLGASLLIRLWKITGETRLRDAALSSLAYSMKYQHPDGAWFYAERRQSHWIDSFHTGFNLEAIRHFLRVGDGLEYESAYRKGVHYYASNFFLDDGTPKYLNKQIYPIDIHAPAESICFFASEGGHSELVDRVLGWTLRNMADKQGYFYFRKGRWFTNRIPYMRWSQAWMFRALTTYIENRNLTPPKLAEVEE